MKTRLLALTILLLLIPAVVFAEDISDASYQGTITATNNSTVASTVSVPFAANTTALIAAGVLNAGATNVVCLSDNGSVTAIMPGYNNADWIVFFDEVTASSQDTATLYTGDVSGGKVAIFGSMVTSDNATLEYGSTENWTYEFDGYVNSDVTGNISKKDGAIWIGVTETGNVTAQIVGTSANVSASVESGDRNIQLGTANISITQTLKETATSLGWGTLRMGQRFDSFKGEIDSITVYLAKIGLPLGSANITVRNATSDAIIGTIGTVDVSTISGVAYTPYTFTDDVIVDTPTDIRIQAEYTGNLSAHINNYYHISDVCDGVRTTYNGATSTDISSSDYSFILTVKPLLNLDVDGADYYSLMYSATVPDTGNDWTDGDTSVTPYINYVKRYVDGVLMQYVEWEYHSTFGDLSGNGNPATPTLRTTSSSASVNATLSSFLPANPAEVIITVEDAYTILTGDLSAPDQMYGDMDFTRVPGADAINELLAEGDVPEDLFWYPFIFFGLAVVGLIVYGATTMTRGRNGQLAEGQFDGSLLTQFVVMEVGLVVIGIMGVIPLAAAYLFPIAGGAIIMSRKHFSWG